MSPLTLTQQYCWIYFACVFKNSIFVFHSYFHISVQVPFISYRDYGNWCLGLQPHFFKFIFHTASGDPLTENITIPFSGWNLRAGSYYPNKTSTHPSTVHTALCHHISDCCSLTIFHPAPIILYIFGFLMWWLETGLYWSMSEFCQEFLKIINCHHLSVGKFALEREKEACIEHFYPTVNEFLK